MQQVELGHAEQLPGILCEVFNHKHLWGVWHQRPCAQSIWPGHWRERHICKAGQGGRVYNRVYKTIRVYPCSAVTMALTVSAMHSLAGASLQLSTLWTQLRLSFLQLALHLQHRASEHGFSTASWAEHAAQYDVMKNIV